MITRQHKLCACQLRVAWIVNILYINKQHSGFIFGNSDKHLKLLSHVKNDFIYLFNICERVSLLNLKFKQLGNYRCKNRTSALATSDYKMGSRELAAYVRKILEENTI